MTAQLSVVHQAKVRAAALRAELEGLAAVESLANEAEAARSLPIIQIRADRMALGSDGSFSVHIVDLVLVQRVRQLIAEDREAKALALVSGDSPATPPAAVEQQPTPNPEPSAVRSTAAEDSTPLDGLPESVARGLEESPSTMMDPGARSKAYMGGRAHAMRGGEHKQPWKAGSQEAIDWSLGYNEAKQLIADEPGFIKAQPEPEAEPEADVQPIPEPEPVAKAAPAPAAKPARKGGLF